MVLNKIIVPPRTISVMQELKNEATTNHLCGMSVPGKDRAFLFGEDEDKINVNAARWVRLMVVYKFIRACTECGFKSVSPKHIRVSLKSLNRGVTWSKFIFKDHSGCHVSNRLE